MMEGLMDDVDSLVAPDLTTDAPDWCASCQSLRQEVKKLQDEQVQNFGKLKQKIISTDLLIKKYKTKCDDYEVQCKKTEEASKKADKLQRQAEILEAQLTAALLETEPLRNRTANLEADMARKTAEAQTLSDRLQSMQSASKQLEHLSQKSALDVERLEAEKRTLVSKIRQLESGKIRVENAKKFKREISELKKEKSSLTKTVTHLEKRLNTALSKVEQLRAKQNASPYRSRVRTGSGSQFQSPGAGSSPMKSPVGTRSLRGGRRRSRTASERSSSSSSQTREPHLLPSNKPDDSSESSSSEDSDDNASLYSSKWRLSPLVSCLSPLPPSPACFTGGKQVRGESPCVGSPSVALSEGEMSDMANELEQQLLGQTSEQEDGGSVANKETASPPSVPVETKPSLGPPALSVPSQSPVKEASHTPATGKQRETSVAGDSREPVDTVKERFDMSDNSLYEQRMDSVESNKIQTSEKETHSNGQNNVEGLSKTGLDLDPLNVSVGIKPVASDLNAPLLVPVGASYSKPAQNFQTDDGIQVSEHTDTLKSSQGLWANSTGHTDTGETNEGSTSDPFNVGATCMEVIENTVESEEILIATPIYSPPCVREIEGQGVPACVQEIEGQSDLPMDYNEECDSKVDIAGDLDVTGQSEMSGGVKDKSKDLLRGETEEFVPGFDPTAELETAGVEGSMHGDDTCSIQDMNMHKEITDKLNLKEVDVKCKQSEVSVSEAENFDLNKKGHKEAEANDKEVTAKCSDSALSASSSPARLSGEGGNLADCVGRKASVSGETSASPNGELSAHRKSETISAEKSIVGTPLKSKSDGSEVKSVEKDFNKTVIVDKPLAVRNKVTTPSKSGGSEIKSAEKSLSKEETVEQVKRQVVRNKAKLSNLDGGATAEEIEVWQEELGQTATPRLTPPPARSCLQRQMALTRGESSQALFKDVEIMKQRLRSPELREMEHDMKSDSNRNDILKKNHTDSSKNDRVDRSNTGENKDQKHEIKGNEHSNCQNKNIDQQLSFESKGLNENSNVKTPSSKKAEPQLPDKIKLDSKNENNNSKTSKLNGMENIFGEETGSMDFLGDYEVLSRDSRTVPEKRSPCGGNSVQMKKLKKTRRKLRGRCKYVDLDSQLSTEAKVDVKFDSSVKQGSLNVSMAGQKIVKQSEISMKHKTVIKNHENSSPASDTSKAIRNKKTSAPDFSAVEGLFLNDRTNKSLENNKTTKCDKASVNSATVHDDSSETVEKAPPPARQLSTGFTVNSRAVERSCSTDSAKSFRNSPKNSPSRLPAFDSSVCDTILEEESEVRDVNSEKQTSKGAKDRTKDSKQSSKIFGVDDSLMDCGVDDHHGDEGSERVPVFSSLAVNLSSSGRQQGTNNGSVKSASASKLRVVDDGEKPGCSYHSDVQHKKYSPEKRELNLIVSANKMKCKNAEKDFDSENLKLSVDKINKNASEESFPHGLETRTDSRASSASLESLDRTSPLSPLSMSPFCFMNPISPLPPSPVREIVDRVSPLSPEHFDGDAENQRLTENIDEPNAPVEENSAEVGTEIRKEVINDITEEQAGVKVEEEGSEPERQGRTEQQVPGEGGHVMGETKRNEAVKDGGEEEVERKTGQKITNNTDVFASINGPLVETNAGQQTISKSKVKRMTQQENKVVSKEMKMSSSNAVTNTSVVVKPVIKSLPLEDEIQLSPLPSMISPVRTPVRKITAVTAQTGVSAAKCVDLNKHFVPKHAANKAPPVSNVSKVTNTEVAQPVAFATKAPSSAVKVEPKTSKRRSSGKKIETAANKPYTLRKSISDTSLSHQDDLSDKETLVKRPRLSTSRTATLAHNDVKTLTEAKQTESSQSIDIMKTSNHFTREQCQNEIKPQLVSTGVFKNRKNSVENNNNNTIAAKTENLRPSVPSSCLVTMVTEKGAACSGNQDVEKGAQAEGPGREPVLGSDGKVSDCGIIMEDGPGSLDNWAFKRKARLAHRPNIQSLKPSKVQLLDDIVMPAPAVLTRKRRLATGNQAATQGAGVLQEKKQCTSGRARSGNSHAPPLSKAMKGELRKMQTYIKSGEAVESYVAMVTSEVGRDKVGSHLLNVTVQCLGRVCTDTLEVVHRVCMSGECPVLDSQFPLLTDVERKCVQLLVHLVDNKLLYEDQILSEMRTNILGADSGPSIVGRMSICRVFTALCALKGDLETVRVLLYSLVTHPTIPGWQCVVPVVSVWPTSLQRHHDDAPGHMVSHAMTLTLEHVLTAQLAASGADTSKKVLEVLQKLCLWSGCPVNIDSMVKLLMTRLAEVTSADNTDTDAVFELVRCLELLLCREPWSVCREQFILRHGLQTATNKYLASRITTPVTPAYMSAVLTITSTVLGHHWSSIPSKDFNQITRNWLIPVLSHSNGSCEVRQRCLETLMEISPFHPSVLTSLQHWFHTHRDSGVPAATLHMLEQLRAGYNAKFSLVCEPFCTR